MTDRFALSVALDDGAGRFLFGFRGDEVGDYKRTWSIPSCLITKSEYQQAIESQSIPKSSISKLCDVCFESSFTLDCNFVKYCIRQRRDYRLHMLLAEGHAPKTTVYRTKKYIELRHLTVDEALKRMNYRVGTCVCLLIQHIIENRKLDSSIQYLEIPPEFNDGTRRIEDLTDSELWEHAAANYGLLRQGESGSDGELIRKVSLDRYVDRYIDRQLPKGGSLIDLGCGTGALVARLSRQGYRAMGVDLFPNPLNVRDSAGTDLRRCAISDIENELKEFTFDLVIMNLVCGWIRKLDLAIEAIKKITDGGSRILMTLVPPEFSKNGRWIVENEMFNWILTEPLRRDPFLVMINRTVGPVRYFPRMTPEYLEAFGRGGFGCTSARYLFLDSLMEAGEWLELRNRRPDLTRHTRFPVFSVFEFRRVLS